MIAAPVIGLAVGSTVYAGRPQPIPVDQQHVDQDASTLSQYPPPSDQTQFWSDKPDCCLPIRQSEKGMASIAPVIIESWMDQAVNKFGNEPAYNVEEPDENGDLQWTSRTWAEVNQEIRSAAKSMISLGVPIFGSVAIIGFNRPEWVISSLGAIWCGAKAAGIYMTNESESAGYIAKHCNAKIIIAEDFHQIGKFIQVIDQLTECGAFVVYRTISDSDLEQSRKYKPTYRWDEFLKISDNDKSLDDALESRISSQRPGNICSLIYTSGTTGVPKATMVSHDAINFMTSHLGEIFQDSGTIPEHAISYLPLSHIAAQILDVYAPIWMSAIGNHPATVWFARPDALKGSLTKTIAAARPTFFFGVPRVWEKFADQIQKVGKEAGGFKKSVATWAKAVGLKSYKNGQLDGSHRSPWMEFLPKHLVFNPIRKKLGFDRCRALYTGAAPISKDTLEYLASIGLTVLELYGMSEGAGASHCNTARANIAGSIGRPMSGIEVKLEHVDGRDPPGQGEILIRGRNLMAGYLYDPEKTAEAIDNEGYLHSGDVGRVDEYGFYYITGRIKELIVTSGGENVAPVPIENTIKKECPALANVLMIGDKRKFNIVLVTLKCSLDKDGRPSEQLEGDALQVNPAITRVSEAANDDKWRAYVNEGVERANRLATSNACKVQKFKILPVDFSVFGGELTPSLKVCRPFIHQLYQNLIDGIYNDASLERS